MSTSYMFNNSASKTKDTYVSQVLIDGVIEKIRTFFKDDLFCDVTLISKDDEYQVNAHKMVLSAASAYFLAMFGGSLREASEKVVKLHQIDGHSLKLVINYIYSGLIELATDTVEEIVKTAHLFELESLKVLCCDFIADRLEPCNCLGIALFADHYDLKKLYSISEDYVCHSFDKVRSGIEFFQLDVNFLSKLLSSNELRIESEEAVYECLMSWVEYDKEKRETFFETLLHCIRLPLVRPLFIVNVIEPACKSIECERLLYKAMKWHQIPEIRPSLFSEKFIQPRPLTQTLIALIGLASDTASVGSFNFGKNEWTYKTCPPSKIRRNGNFGSTLLNGKLIIAGGTARPSIQSTALNGVECLDLETLEWTDLPPMLSNRFNLGMAAIDDSMYVFGGRRNTHSHRGNNRIVSVDSIEKWDPITNNWTYDSDEYVEYASTFEFNLFTIQKKLCAQVRNSMGEIIFHVYDPSAKTWQKNWWTCPTTPLGAGTVRSNQKEELFLVVSRHSFFKINLSDDTRETIPINQPIADEFTKCAMFADHVVIFGEKKFMLYYPFTQNWRTIPDLTNTLGRVVLISNY